MRRCIPFVSYAAMRWRCSVYKGSTGRPRRRSFSAWRTKGAARSGRGGMVACRRSASTSIRGGVIRSLAPGLRAGIGAGWGRIRGAAGHHDCRGRTARIRPRRPAPGPAIGRTPDGCLSPRTVDVHPHLPLATPVAGHPPTPGAPCDPAAGHPYIAAPLPAPVAVRPYIAVRPRRRRSAVVPGGRRCEARAVRIGRAAGYAIRAGGPVHGRRGLGRGAAEPAAGADEGSGQSDGAQQRASIHGVSCSVFEAALH